VLQVDGYAGFERLAAPGDIVLAACWAHARRKFYDARSTNGPGAESFLPTFWLINALAVSRYRRSISARREAANSSARMYFATHDRLGATGA
jgi:hypothetical protein